MKKLGQIIKSIFAQIFPMFATIKINKGLRREAKHLDIATDVEEKEKLKHIKIESLKLKYDETFRIKDKFEDKAKANIVGITIAITIIINASSVLSKIADKYNCGIVNCISFFLLLVAILYLFSAGLLAIKSLCDYNIMYFVSIENLSNNRLSSKEEYMNCIKKNEKYNNVRNNSIYCSYQCIRNAIISVFFILLFVAFPI